MAVVEAQPGAPAPKVTMHRRIVANGYGIELLSFEVAQGVHVPGMLAIPDAAGIKPAVLLVSPQPKSQIAAEGGDFDSLAQAGHVVLAISPRGIQESGGAARASVLGDYGVAMRSAVIGKTLIGMRTDDILHAANYLAQRPDVQKNGIAAFGQGALGVPVLHAALLDNRIRKVLVQDMIVSYWLAVDRPLHRNLYDVAIPGVLRRYDLNHILNALGPAAVTVLNPADAYGNPLRLEPLRKQFEVASHVRFENRIRRDPLSAFLKASPQGN